MKVIWMPVAWYAITAAAFRALAFTATPHRAIPRTASTTSLSLSSTDENDASPPSLEGKTIYQRTFFRLQPSPSLPLHNAIVIEERLRYRPSADDPTFMEPFGPRSLLLRDGQVEEGAIGDEFQTIHVHEVPPRSTKNTNPSTLQHGGRTGSVDESLVLALVLAAQPERFYGPVLEIAAKQGLGTLVGCLGAAFASQTPEERAAAASASQKAAPDEEDVLTVPTDHKDYLWPKDLTSLTLTDSDAVMLDLCATQIAGLPGTKMKQRVHAQMLDWRTRVLPMAHNHPNRQRRREYATVALADLPLTFPETKEMARTIAHRVGPSNPSIARFLFQDDRTEADERTSAENSSTGKPSLPPIPRFVHVSREAREESVYLRKYLTEGCRMEVNTDYVTVEKIGFGIQSIDTVPPSEENALLDALELEVASVDEMVYQVLTAQHHVDYTGGGSGEVFFPMEATDFSVGRRGGEGRGPETAREPGSFLG